VPKLRRNSFRPALRDIRRSLLSIVRALERLAPALEAAGRRPAAESRRGRKLKLSPERRASLKLQGQYMGQLRNLKPRQKSRVKALRAKRGVQSAIRLAMRLGGK